MTSPYISWRRKDDFQNQNCQVGQFTHTPTPNGQKTSLIINLDLVFTFNQAGHDKTLKKLHICAAQLAFTLTV